MQTARRQASTPRMARDALSTHGGVYSQQEGRIPIGYLGRLDENEGPDLEMEMVTN
jgi:hypothetical protein